MEETLNSCKMEDYPHFSGSVIKVPFDCILSNIPAKNYQNRLMYVEVIASQSNVDFLGHSVYTLTAD